MFWCDAYSVLCTHCSQNEACALTREVSNCMIRLYACSRSICFCSIRDLVIAAEKCPAKCIHPGKPINPQESGLEDLIKRAAAFN